MAKKSNKNAASRNDHAGGEADATQLWNALKKADLEMLQSILMQEEEGAGEGVLVPKSSARTVLSQCNNKKALPLVHAVSESLDLECVHLLLRAGAPVNQRDETKAQSSALHAACWNDDETLIPLLLRCGADPRVVDAEGRTPLHILASSTAAPLMDLVLESVANPPAHASGDLTVPGKIPLCLDPLDLLSKQEKHGLTPLHISIGEAPFGKPFVANTLLKFLEETKMGAGTDTEATAKKVDSLVRLPSRDHNTAMHLLFVSPGGDARVLLKTLKELLQLGAPVECWNVHDETPLHLALYAIGDTRANNTDVQEQIFAALLNGLLTPNDNPKSAASVGAVLTKRNHFGEAWIHTLISQRCSVALIALEKFMEANPSLATLVKESIAACTTSREESTAEILAGEVSAEEGKLPSSLERIVTSLIRLGTVQREELDEMVEIMRRMDAEAAAEENEGLSPVDGDYSGHGPSTGGVESPTGTNAVSSRLAPGSGPAAGVSRVQRARKSRALRYMKDKQEREKRRGDGEELGDSKEEEEEEAEAMERNGKNKAKNKTNPSSTSASTRQSVKHKKKNLVADTNEIEEEEEETEQPRHSHKATRGSRSDHSSSVTSHAGSKQGSTKNNTPVLIVLVLVVVTIIAMFFTSTPPPSQAGPY